MTKTEMIGRTEGYSYKTMIHAVAEATERQTGGFRSDTGDSVTTAV